MNNVFKAAEGFVITPYAKATMTVPTDHYTMIWIIRSRFGMMSTAGRVPEGHPLLHHTVETLILHSFVGLAIYNNPKQQQSESSCA